MSTKKTNFFGNSNASIEQIGDCNELILRPKIETPTANKVSCIIAGFVLNCKVCGTHQHHLGLIQPTTQSATKHTPGPLDCLKTLLLTFHNNLLTNKHLKAYKIDNGSIRQ